MNMKAERKENKKREADHAAGRGGGEQHVGTGRGAGGDHGANRGGDQKRQRQDGQHLRGNHPQQHGRRPDGTGVPKSEML